MTRTASAKPHRKFIALVLAASLVISGFSAAPARAGDDVAKFIAGAALLGILGAAINDAKQDRRDRHKQTTHRPYKQHHPKPIPPRVARYDLPAKCVRNFHGHGPRSILSRGCLKRNYTQVQNLPRSCRISYWNGDRQRKGYGTRCLHKHGYRLVHR